MPINWRFLAWWVPVNLLAVATAAAFSLYVILRAVEAAAIGQDGYAGFLVWAWLVFAFLAVLPSFICEVANV